MDQKEFGQFVMALRTYYPREKILPNKEAMELWFRQLEDIPYSVAEAGLQKWVAIEKWSPSIADIRQMATSVTEGEVQDWGAAWEKVQKAIRRWGSYQPQEAMESLDELSQQAVKQIGWQNLCFSENVAADRANFRLIYERLAERKKTDRLIPEKLKNLIGQMQIGMIDKREEQGA